VEVIGACCGGTTYDNYATKVTLDQLYQQNITVNVTMYRDGNRSINSTFSITVAAGSLTAESGSFSVPLTESAGVEINSISPLTVMSYNGNYSTQGFNGGCGNEITATYAGVTITYEANSNILRFNSTQDVNTVLSQLDADYDYHNDTYEDQYPNLTAEQLDAMDAQTGFDQFKPFRDFENLFPGFSTKRAQIENTEITWLNNNFGGLDPDDIDLTFDNAANTIFNADYSFKVGNDVYQLTSTGLDINGTLQARNTFNGPGSDLASGTFIINEHFTNANHRMSGPNALNYDELYATAIYSANPNKTELLGPNCRTNKRRIEEYKPTPTRMFRIKVAILSIGIRSTVKTKVVHFKLENGSSKRARAEMAVSVQGVLVNTVCNWTDNVAKNKPPNRL
jgi:hypothetical protein